MLSWMIGGHSISSDLNYTGCPSYVPVFFKPEEEKRKKQKRTKEEEEKEGKRNFKMMKQ